MSWFLSLINVSWKTLNTNVIHSIHLKCNEEIKWWSLVNVVAETSNKSNTLRIFPVDLASPLNQREEAFLGLSNDDTIWLEQVESNRADFSNQWLQNLSNVIKRVNSFNECVLQKHPAHKDHTFIHPSSRHNRNYEKLDITLGNSDQDPSSSASVTKTLQQANVGVQKKLELGFSARKQKKRERKNNWIKKERTDTVTSNRRSLLG
jgi:hypothetical protein